VAGDTILFTQGSYAAQGTSSQPSISGTKAVTVQGNGVVKIRQINLDASNVTFDGLDLDAAGTTTSGAVFETGGGANIVFKNGRIGNVVDEKGALVGGNVDPTPLNNTFDNVVFHDIRVQNSTTHNEAMYIMAPGTVVKNSTFCVPQSDCGNTGAILTQRGSWWGQQPWNGLRFLNNQFGRMMFDHGSILFGNHCGDVGATCSDIQIRGNTFDPRSMPANATPNLSYTNSFESCNSQPVNLPGFTHEACVVHARGLRPEPTVPTATRRRGASANSRRRSEPDS
jgi:hypothetical protein